MPSPRCMHVLDMAMYEGFVSGKLVRAVDLSQRPTQNLKCVGDQGLKVITPGSIIYVPAKKRPLCAEEKAILMGFNLAALDVSTVTSNQLRA